VRAAVKMAALMVVNAETQTIRASSTAARLAGDEAHESTATAFDSLMPAEPQRGEVADVHQEIERRDATMPPRGIRSMLRSARVALRGQYAASFHPP